MRIDGIQSVCQYTNRLVAIFQCLLMRSDIDTIRQSADDQHLWAICSQLTDQPTDKVLSIRRTMTSTDNRYDLRLIQVGSSPIIQNDRCIRTLFEPLRISRAVQCQYLNLMTLNKLQFCLRPTQRFRPVAKCLFQSWGTIMNDVPNFVTVFVKLRSTAHRPIKVQCLCEIKVTDACQRHRIQYFLCIHIALSLRLCFIYCSPMYCWKALS